MNDEELARKIFEMHLGPPMYPRCIYLPDYDPWPVLYSKAFHGQGGDQSWRRLIDVLRRLGWRPPAEEASP